MALDGLFALACAAVIAAPPSPSAPASGGYSGVSNTLAVQTAMQKGRDLLLQRDARGAVLALEAQLARINGNREYLMLLRDAYRAYLKDLYLKNQTDEARKYLERLCILDPDAAKDKSLRTALDRPPARMPAARAAPESPARSAPVARAKGEDDPFDPAHENKGGGPRVRVREEKPLNTARNSEAARRLLGQAEAAFARERYAEARVLFDAAHQQDESATAACGDRWAYCKLHYVVEQLNAKDADRPAWADLEREVRVALVMSPRLNKTADWLLEEIRDRREGKGGRTGQPAAAPVKHLNGRLQGWSVAETANFRIFHNQSRELVDRAARVAEESRSAMTRKWFGGDGGTWTPRCDLYLHADGTAYSRQTGVPANSPGHSRIETDAGRVVSRRIDVRCDNPNLLSAVLPHETTHVVLAGRFGKHQVPRWADEGMAVLTEPADKVAQHRKNLAKCRQDGQLFPVRDLMQLTEYPQPRLIGAFYAQSVSLVDFLTREKGAVVFAQFLREALDAGYEPALRKFYPYRSFAELQDSWGRSAFGTSVTQAKPRQ